MDEKGTADISPSARFGVKESYVTKKLYDGLVNLYKIEKGEKVTPIVFLQEARKKYLNDKGEVDWDKVQKRWEELKSKQVSRANKYFTKEVY